MPGPAPKPAAERANRTPPSRGEWVDVYPLEVSVLPDLPAGTRWSKRTKAWWEGLRADPVTSLFGDCEIAQCVEMAHLHKLALSENTATCWGEVRQWMDRLGFTLKGKRDLRIRVAGDGPRSLGAAGTLVAMPSRR